jgi:solute carrier family 25 carnitine/acylcarnitine transporter 20/29
MLLDPSVTNPAEVPFTDLSKIWLAGAAGGLATWIVSAPTEVVKCRTQLGTEAKGSWLVAKDIWRHCGVRGFYLGGGVTSIRDSVGYGF